LLKGTRELNSGVSRKQRSAAGKTRGKLAVFLVVFPPGVTVASNRIVKGFLMQLAHSVGMSLSKALRGPFSLAATGALEVTTHGERHRIFLRGGYVVAVELARGQDPLGLVLTETGILSVADLRSSLSRRAPDLYGVSLVRDSVVTAEGVARGLRAQMARRAARILALEDARFRFEAGPLPAHALAAIDARLHPLELLVLAMRHPSCAQRCLARVLPLKSVRLKLTVTVDALRRLPALRDALVDTEWHALAELAAGTTVSELISGALLPAALASALVESLLLCAVLDEADAGARPRVSPTAAPSRSAGERATPAAAAASPADPLAEIRLAVRRGADPHRLLGVAPGCGADVLRAAYRRRALLLHPDRWTEDAPADLGMLFAAVSGAYRTLTAGAARAA